jgi:hypothetical protein
MRYLFGVGGCGLIFLAVIATFFSLIVWNYGDNRTPAFWLTVSPILMASGIVMLILLAAAGKKDHRIRWSGPVGFAALSSGGTLLIFAALVWNLLPGLLPLIWIIIGIPLLVTGIYLVFVHSAASSGGAPPA